MSLKYIAEKRLIDGIIYGSNVFCQSRSLVTTPHIYSQYPSHFIEPIFQRQDLINMKKSGDAEKLRYVPIKAAKAEQTSSQFYDPVLEKFINYVMKDGKKELARKLVNKTLETIKRIQVERYNKETDPSKKNNIELNPLNIFHSAVENCKPLLQLIPIKRGGQTYQVPVAISDNRAGFLAMNWFIDQGKADSKNTRFYYNLARELINASQNQGRVLKKKQDLHKQCEANRAYAHYRWG